MIDDDATTGHYRFAHAARMEWIKLRSLRSTWWTLAVTIAAAAGIAVAVGVNTEDATADLTNNALAGISVGLLPDRHPRGADGDQRAPSGTIRSADRDPEPAAGPGGQGGGVRRGGPGRRGGGVLRGLLRRPGGPAAGVAGPALGQPGVLRAVVLGGAGYCLIGLLGLGLGAVVRHTPVAVGLLVGGVYVVAQLGAALAPVLMPYLPIAIVANS